ncbi:MAG: hypothetical protein AAF211_28600, partial [Myxococcota bacterium]
MVGFGGFPVVHGAAPEAPEPVRPRDVGALWREASVAWEAVRLVGAAPGLLGARRGRARTVVLVPGYKTSSR